MDPKMLAYISQMKDRNAEFWLGGPGAVAQLKTGPNAIKSDERGNAILLMRTYAEPTCPCFTVADNIYETGTTTMAAVLLTCFDATSSVRIFGLHFLHFLHSFRRLLLLLPLLRSRPLSGLILDSNLATLELDGKFDLGRLLAYHQGRDVIEETKTITSLYDDVAAADSAATET
jgi:hypothetical protein